MEQMGRQGGFTLVELMAVLLVLGLILVIAVPKVGSMVDKTEKKADRASISMIERAGEMAYVDGLVSDSSTDELYYVPTLVMNGFLDIKDVHKLNISENYVVRESNRKFKFNGEGVTGEVPPVAGGGGSNGTDGNGSIGNDKEEQDEDVPENECSKNFRTDTRSGMFAIAKYIGTCQDVVVPKELNGKTVEVIGSESFWYPFGDRVVKSVAFPDTIVKIEHYAFYMQSLTTVKIPHKVKELPVYAFSANKLTSIRLSNDLEVLGPLSLSGNQLTSIVIPEKVRFMDREALARNPLKEVVIKSELLNITNVNMSSQSSFPKRSPSDNAVMYGPPNVEAIATALGYTYKPLSEYKK